MSEDYGSGSNPGNDPYKSYPKAIPVSAYGKATLPTALVIQPRASSVIVKSTADDETFAFLYETTCSIGTTSNGFSEGYITGSSIMADGGSITLPIQPVAWRRTDGASGTGDITFVYTGR